MHEILLPASRLIRLRNSYQHPNRATLASRIPFFGRRVPLRPFWRRRSVRTSLADRFIRRAEPVTTPALDVTYAARRAAGAAAATTAAAASKTKEAANKTATIVNDARSRVHIERPSRRKALRRAAPIVAAGAAVGVLAMFYLDPSQGKRRRALTRDKFTRVRKLFTKDVPATLERRGRFFRGVARGVRHEAAEALINGHRPPVDDETLVDRVRSEALRDARYKAGEIHVEAHLGRVTLRGQIEQPDDIRTLVDRTRHVEGVAEVRSYLHTPGTPAPNKADVSMPVPAHMAGAG